MKRTMLPTSLCLLVCLTAVAAIPTPERCALDLVECSDTAIEQESDLEMVWDLNKCQMAYNVCLRKN
ncbi:MAG: hypothetical protein HKN17_11225 [Rhodothermales bacterium]|nr:hypothetical protein [Rhodothermales bacterium]